MFSKAKRFEPKARSKTQAKAVKALTKANSTKPDDIKALPKTSTKSEDIKTLTKTSCTKPEDIKASAKTSSPNSEDIKVQPRSTNTKLAASAAKVKPFKPMTPIKPNIEVRSKCSSASSIKSFVTPKAVKPISISKPSSLKKPLPPVKTPVLKKRNTEQNEIIKDQEVEIRNKDYTIAEYNKQIEDLKNELTNLQKQLNEAKKNSEVEKIDKELAQMVLEDEKKAHKDETQLIKALQNKITELQKQCKNLEYELCGKQVELTSMEQIIVIRDSLCQDLQNKLTTAETSLEESKQRLEMVKGHHALALEANESIRREYKAEIETLKSKLEEEKQAIISKSRADQENVKSKYLLMIEAIKNQLIKEKEEIVCELQEQLSTKELEMKAKIEQIEETAHEKLRLCEIQFEERSQNIQEHWNQQLKKMQHLENEIKELTFELATAEKNTNMLQMDLNHSKLEIESLRNEKSKLAKEIEQQKEESKIKFIDFENEINRLTVLVDKATKDKAKFETSLSVTRDIVEVLTMRLRDSDNELELLEEKVQSLTNSKEALENELSSYKNSFNNTMIECNEYKDALVNILKSKATLAKEHTRMMEHNVSLIESLQNVEKEAYRELGSIKNELLEDVELLKKESKSQIQMLQEEVLERRAQCERAAAAAAAAAAQARELLARAGAELARLEADNQRLGQQIQDQQSLVVELSLLRQENEELSMTVAKQSSVIEKMKKDMEDTHLKPKSPSVMRKIHKVGKENIGKENLPMAISPLRERNH